MLHSLLYAILLIQAGQPQGKPAAAPIVISNHEGAQHRIDQDPLFIRVPGARGFDFIQVNISLDSQGTVTSAHADFPEPSFERKYSPSLLARAESIVRDQKYAPITRGGQPVPASFRETVALLPPELKPAKHIPFPRVRDWNSVEIGLSRASTGWVGWSPAYSIQISGDGSVIYEGKSAATFTGRHRGFISPQSVIGLVKDFEKADFYSLPAEYRSSGGDFAIFTISISIDGKRKQLVDYAGLQRGMPLSVWKLENEIDRVSGSERWTRGNADTVAALEAEHWDFKSPEAAATLVRAADKGDAAVVRDLVREGVPLTGLKLTGKSGEGRSALRSAAGGGNVEMLRALLDAGAAADSRALNSAVIGAAYSGNVEAYRLLLSYGAPPKSQDSNGNTVLMAAAESGHPAMVRELLLRHADVNAANSPPPAICSKYPDNCGRTALMEAARGNDYYDAPPEGVDRLEVMRLLLAAGADVNARDQQGNTALMLCDQDAQRAELLLKAGADPNARNLKGQAAIQQTNDEDVKRVLRRYGAVETMPKSLQ